MERYGGGPIVVAEYDPDWPVKFERERGLLTTSLHPLVLSIEHMGSTAVPGLAAKPIIDLLVLVRSLTEVRGRCLESLPPLGYTHVTEYESWLPGELFFRKGVPGPWTHHAHIMEHANPRWPDWLLFRDHLRTHAEVARAYANVKKALAAEFGDDIAGYRTGKNAFVSTVMAQARAARNAGTSG